MGFSDEDRPDGQSGQALLDRGRIGCANLVDIGDTTYRPERNLAGVALITQTVKPSWTSGCNTWSDRSDRAGYHHSPSNLSQSARRLEASVASLISSVSEDATTARAERNRYVPFVQLRMQGRWMRCGSGCHVHHVQASTTPRSSTRAECSLTNWLVTNFKRKSRNDKPRTAEQSHLTLRIPASDKYLASRGLFSPWGWVNVQQSIEVEQSQFQSPAAIECLGESVRSVTVWEGGAWRLRQWIFRGKLVR